MKIYFYNNYGSKYEIYSIEYTNFNGRSTVVEYSKIDTFTNNTNVVSFECWLSLLQIINYMEEIIED